MKAEEKQLMFELNVITGKRFTEALNQYSSYDCYTDNAIVELKVRAKAYDDKLIEVSKLGRNLLEAKEQGKDFVYVVKDPKGIYYANITKRSREILSKPPIKIRCPKTTEFNNNEYVYKPCYTIQMQKL